MSIFSKLYWRIKREQISILAGFIKKEGLKLSFAVVVAEVLMVGGFYFASKHGIVEYFTPKTRTIIINNAQAKVVEGDITKTKIEPQEDKRKSATFYTYNAEEHQTDGNPYRTASGRIVKDGIVANNCLPFETKIEVEGIGVLEVQDRMNSRYGCNDFDVFKENQAHNFKKTLKYNVID